MFDELLQSLGQALENKFKKVINKDIYKELQLHTAQVKHLKGISMFCFHIVGKKKFHTHTEMECFLDRVCFANPF